MSRSILLHILIQLSLTTAISLFSNNNGIKKSDGVVALYRMYPKVSFLNNDARKDIATLPNQSRLGSTVFHSPNTVGTTESIRKSNAAPQLFLKSVSNLQFVESNLKKECQEDIIKFCLGRNEPNQEESKQKENNKKSSSPIKQKSLVYKKWDVSSIWKRSLWSTTPSDKYLFPHYSQPFQSSRKNQFGLNTQNNLNKQNIDYRTCLWNNRQFLSDRCAKIAVQGYESTKNLKSSILPVGQGSPKNAVQPRYPVVDNAVPPRYPAQPRSPVVNRAAQPKYPVNRAAQPKYPVDRAAQPKYPVDRAAQPRYPGLSIQQDPQFHKVKYFKNSAQSFVENSKLNKIEEGLRGGSPTSERQYLRDIPSFQQQKTVFEKKINQMPFKSLKSKEFNLVERNEETSFRKRKNLRDIISMQQRNTNPELKMPGKPAKFIQSHLLKSNKDSSDSQFAQSKNLPFSPRGMKDSSLMFQQSKLGKFGEKSQEYFEKSQNDSRDLKKYEKPKAFQAFQQKSKAFEKPTYDAKRRENLVAKRSKLHNFEESYALFSVQKRNPSNDWLSSSEKHMLFRGNSPFALRKRKYGRNTRSEFLFPYKDMKNDATTSEKSMLFSINQTIKKNHLFTCPCRALLTAMVWSLCFYLVLVIGHRLFFGSFPDPPHHTPAHSVSSSAYAIPHGAPISYSAIPQQ